MLSLSSKTFIFNITYGKERKFLMKKRILGLLVAILLIVPFMSAIAADEVSCDNLNYTFTDIDGGDLPTKSEGKPKLLIFFMTGCPNCQNTFTDIESSTWIRTGETDVYAIEITNNQTQDKIKEFQTKYCPTSPIRFALGDMIGVNTAEKYYQLTGVAPGTQITTPLIAMIDTENKVRYISNGPINATEIESLLPALSSGKDNSQKPVETGKPGSRPEIGESDESGDKPEVVCDHVWEKTLVNGATANSDAVAADVCIKCGITGTYEMIPNSAYATFLNDAAASILNAKQENVVIKTGIWTSFNKTVFNAIQSRPDVSVTVNYFYKGEPYVLNIPAGTDISLLMDENGFGGFLYINKILNTLG